MTTLNIGYRRRVDVSIEVSIVDSSISTDELMEGLTNGTYEVMTGTGQIINCKGDVVATYTEYEENDEYHGDFELFE